MTPDFGRRRFLLRAAGVGIALPAFESLRPALRAAAPAMAGAGLATTATGAPLRTAFVFFPNGAIPSAWWPAGAGTDFRYGSTLAPLEPVRKQVQVVGGLDLKAAVGGPDGGGDHARGTGCFLTGVRLKKHPTDVRAGVSIDQVMARGVGHLTRFPSLELSCDPGVKAGGCDANYACAYQFNLSWTSPTTPKTPEANPRLAFERLFGDGKPGERRANLRRRQQEERSVLDFVLDDARAMRSKLDRQDRGKLDEYLTGVREIEARIGKAERFGDRPDPADDTPPGIPSDFAEYVRLTYDLLALAFQTDSTRVATLMLAHDGNNQSFDHIGIVEGHHDLTHHQNRREWVEKVAAIDRWYVQQFARFLEKLGQTRDVDGNSLLHNSMIVYGSGNADGNRHSHDNLPILLAGSGGGTLNPGRYVDHGGKPATSLYLALAHRLGLQTIDRFGDSAGPLANI